MRLSHLLITYVSMSFSLSIASAALANDAPINLQGGGAQALSGPLTVSMKSEVVKIILGKSSYTVDATFNFFNSGNPVELSVGFPKNGAGYLDERFSHTSDFISFQTWVDGKQVDFEEKANIASIEGIGYTLPELVKAIKNLDGSKATSLAAKDYRWMVKRRVQFPSGKTTTTRVRYDAPYQDVGSECKGALTYIYGTGSFWQGNIGESQFILDATGIPEADRPDQLSFFAEKDKGRIKCSTMNNGAMQCIIKDYKPATEDAGVVVGVGCIDHSREQ